MTMASQKLKLSGNHLRVYSSITDGVDEMSLDEMRPRSKTMPSRERRSQLLLLPKITVEDCSEKLDDKAGSDKEDRLTLKQPFRRRAFTCPDDMFRRKVPRPPTPPPFVSSGSLSKGKTKFVFPRKKLGQVAEVKSESNAGDDSKDTSFHTNTALGMLGGSSFSSDVTKQTTRREQKSVNVKNSSGNTKRSKQDGPDYCLHNTAPDNMRSSRRCIGTELIT